LVVEAGEQLGTSHTQETGIKANDHDVLISCSVKANRTTKQKRAHHVTNKVKINSNTSGGKYIISNCCAVKPKCFSFVYTRILYTSHYFAVLQVVCGVHFRLLCAVDHAATFVVNNTLVASPSQ